MLLQALKKQNVSFVLRSTREVVASSTRVYMVDTLGLWSSPSESWYIAAQIVHAILQLLPPFRYNKHILVKEKYAK
jgi:3-deoxy-D-manno-octulosonic-acid transferase